MSIVIIYRNNFNTPAFSQNNDGYFILVKGTFYQWYITIRSKYTPNTEVPIFIKETLGDLTPLINKRVLVGVFNTHFHQLTSHPEKKINQKNAGVK